MPPQINFKEEDGAAESDGDFVDMDGGQEEELDELQDDMPAAHADASALPKALFPGINRPTMRAFEAKMLYEMVRDGRINLTPKYQRDEVWNSEVQAGVITSYLQNYHVPPLVLSEKDDGRFDCIDGKQRLTSIKKFFAGELPVLSPGVNTRFWYVRNDRNKNKNGSTLPSAHKLRVEKLEVYANIYAGLNNQQEREMFKRVQDGKSLNLAEKLQAVESEWANYIRELNDGIPEQYWERIHFRTSRMSSFLSLCRLVWYLTRLGYPSNSRLDSLPDIPSGDDLRGWLNQKIDMPKEELKEFSPGGREITAPTAKFKALVDALFKKFLGIINSKECFEVAFCPVSQLSIAGDETWVQRHYQNGVEASRMTTSPVEVICSCIYISRNIRLHPATLARGIHNIRNLIYERFVNERKLNKKVMAQFFNWLQQHNGDGGLADDYRVSTLPPDTGPEYVPGTYAPSPTKNAQLPQKRGAEAPSSSPATPMSKKKRTEIATPAPLRENPEPQSSTDAFTPIEYAPH